MFWIQPQQTCQIQFGSVFGYGQLRPLRPVMAITASVQPELDRTTSRIQFGSVFFQRRPGSRCAKPTRIRSGWPGQVLVKRIWSRSKPVWKNHRAPVPSRTQPAYCQFSIFRLGCVLLLTARITLCKTNPERIRFGLHVCVRPRPNGSGPEASRCAAITRSTRSTSPGPLHPVHFWPTVPSRSDPACLLGRFVCCFLNITFWFLLSYCYILAATFR